MHLETTAGIAFAEYLQVSVLDPLGMRATALDGSPANGIVSSVDDLLTFGHELLEPLLVGRDTLDVATRPHLGELSGMLPGVGRMDPNPWGLTFEIKGDKHPHWTGTRNSPRTFGHFGGTGTFLWADPEAGMACVALTDHRFGPWALKAWPAFSDAVLGQAASAPPRLPG